MLYGVNIASILGVAQLYQAKRNLFKIFVASVLAGSIGGKDKIRQIPPIIVSGIVDIIPSLIAFKCLCSLSLAAIGINFSSKKFIIALLLALIFKLPIYFHINI